MSGDCVSRDPQARGRGVDPACQSVLVVPYESPLEARHGRAPPERSGARGPRPSTSARDALSKVEGRERRRKGVRGTKSPG